MKSLKSTKSIALAALAASAVLSPLALRAQTSVPISSVYAGGAGTYTVTGTVTSVLDVYATTNSNSFTIADATGSVIVYSVPEASYTATVGDNITITTTNAPYQGSPEFTKTGFTLNSTNSTGNSVSPAVLTLAQFNAAGTGSTTKTAVPPYAEALVTLDNVTLPAGTTTLATNTNYTLTDTTGTGVLYGYKSYSNVMAAVNAANSAETASSNALYAGPLDITGYVDVYNGAPEIYPLSIVAAPEPSTYVLMGCGALATVLFARRTRWNKLS